MNFDRKELKELFVAADKLKVCFQNTQVIQAMQINQKVLETMGDLFASIPRCFYDLSLGVQQSAFFKIQNIINGYSDIFGRIQEISNTILKNLEITEEQKNEIKDVAKKWGGLGWSFPPNAPLKLLRSFPQDIKIANRLMRSYCTPSEMEQIFEEIKHERKIRLNDFNEAVVLFRQKNYKSCTLLLFSFIDAIILRAQPKKLRNNGSPQKREIGKSGLKVVLKDIDEAQSIERTIFLLKIYFCFMYAYEEIYKSGGDFRKQFKIINRNFLSHGMLTRKVTRQDCVQVFLLYYNLLMFMDDFPMLRKAVE